MATVDKINPKKQKEMFETDFPLNTTGDKDRKKRKNQDNNILNMSENCPQVGQFCPEDHMDHQTKRSYHGQYAPTFSSIKIQKDSGQPAQTDRKKRNRKNPNQMQYLMQEYNKDPNWSKDTCQRVSQATGLTESQVYKWSWDQKNKKAEEAILE